MQPSPLISVVVPAYNAKATIGETLHSISHQTYSNIEVLVIDDGSSDGTSDIVAAAANLDHRISLLRQPNQGVASARNAGISRATGEFIAPIDADDLWHPQKLEKQMAVMLEAGSDLAFVYTFCRVIDEKGRVILSTPSYSCKGRVFCQHILLNFVGNGSALLARKAFVTSVGGYDGRLRDHKAEGCEDYLLQLRLARRYRVGVVPAYLVGYRRIPGRMSSDHEQMLKSRILALEMLKREGRDVPDCVFKWALATTYHQHAYSALTQRRWPAALRLVPMALQQDPERTIEFAGDVLSGLARRVARRPRVQVGEMKVSERPLFWECDPEPVTYKQHKPVSKRRLAFLRELDELGDI